MSAAASRGDDRPLTSWSTSEVDRKDRFAVWHDLISDKLLRVVARADYPNEFSAAISMADYPDFQLLHARASNHELRMTRRTIAMNDEAFFSAAFPLSGRVVVEQERSQASLAAGEFAFWDTTRPGSLRFDDDASLIVVRTPLAWAETLIAGPSRRDRLLARRFAHQGGSALVADFIHGLARLGRHDPAQARLISGNVPTLLGSALAVADGRELDQSQTHALSRAQVVTYLKRHLTDPSLDADQVAQAFNVSRRSLYRLFAEPVGDPTRGVGGGVVGETLHATLRRLRVNRAMHILRSDEEMPLRIVARACGFGTEATLYRSFLRLQGRSPGQYRSALRAGPTSELVPNRG